MIRPPKDMKNPAVIPDGRNIKEMLESDWVEDRDIQFVEQEELDRMRAEGELEQVGT